MENQNETKIAKVGNVWIRLDELKAWEEHHKKLHDQWLNYILWGVPFPVREPQPEDNVKLALVDGNRMIGVDNKTMLGYELRDDCPAIKIPLVPTTYKTFTRWARLMDV